MMNKLNRIFCIDQGGGKSQVNITEDTSPTLTTTHGGEPAVFSAGFCTEHSANARGIGYQEECSPTLRSGVTPATMVLNDQGGSVMDISEDVTSTLRAENHGHPPIVFEPGAATRVGGHVYDDEITGTLRANAGDNAQVFCYGIDQQGGKGMVGYGVDVSPTLAAESHGTPHAVCYGISAYDSNAMKSSNPYSGIYIADTSRTLDLNGGNPGCNQGGMMVVEPVVYPGVNITSPINGANPQPGDPCHTLTNDNRNYVVFTQNEREEVRDLGDKSGSLSAEPGTHQQTYVLENHPNDSRIKICEDNTFQTLSSRMGTGGNNTPMVMETSMAVESHAQDARYNMGEINQTLGANMQHDAANGGLVYGVDTYNQTQSIEQTKTLNSAATDSDHIPCTYTQGDNINMKQTAIVRRLTPTECSRLQGMPDGWCDIGEWVDENGKKHKDADAPKYKALGNGIALPFWQWLAYRVTDQLKADGVENPTLFSMFDGIGSFCLAFKRAGCEPVAVSEIESYPIAVCKKHFGDEETGEVGDVEKYL